MIDCPRHGVVLGPSLEQRIAVLEAEVAALKRPTLSDVFRAETERANAVANRGGDAGREVTPAAESSEEECSGVPCHCPSPWFDREAENATDGDAGDLW